MVFEIQNKFGLVIISRIVQKLLMFIEIFIHLMIKQYMQV